MLATDCEASADELWPFAHLSEWSEFISDLLAAMGWPGDKELTAREEEMINHWKDRLSAFSSLGLVSAPTSLHTAVASSASAGHAIGAGDWSSPIQVLDLSQDLELLFDSAIAVGLSEETWPPLARISPLVPLKLQRLIACLALLQQSAHDARVLLTKMLFMTAPDVLVTFNATISTLARSFVTGESKREKLWDKDLALDAFPWKLWSALPTDKPRRLWQEGICEVAPASSKRNRNVRFERLPNTG